MSKIYRQKSIVLDNSLGYCYNNHIFQLTNWIHIFIFDKIRKTCQKWLCQWVLNTKDRCSFRYQFCIDYFNDKY